MNGKTLGPFSIGQLQGFRDKGRLRSDHELSTNRERWFPAGQVPDLFASAESPVTYHFARDEPAPAASNDVEWYVEIDGDRRGPLSLAKLRSLIAAGKVAEDDLVWRSGFGDWQPAEDFPELFETDGSAPARSRSSRRTRSQDRDGVWNRFLQAVRHTVTEDDLERICRSMVSLGRASITLGALVVMTFLMVRAVEANSLSGTMMAIATGLVLLALQYVGSRMAEASLSLATASRYRLSSQAFPSSVAVALLAFGLFLGATLIAVQLERSAILRQFDAQSSAGLTRIIIGIVMAVEVFIPFLYGFFASLHPRWMAVDCGEPVGAGEDGVGSCAFLLKVGLRFVPISYGISAVLGALGSIAAVALYFSGKSLRSDALEVAAASQTSLFAAVVIPATWYLLASVASIFLDFMLPNARAISEASQRTHNVT